ncbi:hypothetical protein [Psychromonas algicola]|uniref:hypothetical protein n=1 Tax=Psychromonas algicola TaxID=2555642 RepID=UPI0010676E0F|nr:hypothetical protein [Psychromonas sp. RZ5]TEW52527.1 hypothetical protein E2R67_02520 [Psychromonas sp. RZ5]
MLTKSRLIQLLIMLCLLIGLFIWRTIESMTDKQATTSDETSIEALILDESVCDFSKDCTFNSPFGAFTLSVEEREITPESWFHLTLKSELKNWKVLSAKTIGKTMFMGKIPMQFSQVTEIEGQFISTTKSMVGVCTTDRMLWRFDITVEVDNTPVNLYYDFLIIR